jgi:hypothetical protein
MEKTAFGEFQNRIVKINLKNNQFLKGKLIGTISERFLRIETLTGTRLIAIDSIVDIRADEVQDD